MHMFASAMPLIQPTAFFIGESVEKPWDSSGCRKFREWLPTSRRSRRQAAGLIVRSSIFTWHDPARVLALEELLRQSVWTSSYSSLLKICKCLWIFVAEVMEGRFAHLFLSVYSARLFCGRVTG